MTQPRRASGKKTYFSSPTAAPKRAKKSNNKIFGFLDSVGNKRAFLIFLLVCLLIITFFGIVYARNVNHLNELKTQKEALQLEKEVLVEENQELQEIHDFVNTREYIVFQARKLLGWVMPEDEKYTVVEEEAK